MSRREALAANLRDVERRIASACEAAGRDRSQVTLVAVTKTWPARDAQLLVELGVRDLAENRDSEARAKALDVTGARWHFVGTLQTNKARSVARYADLVHSVDRAGLVTALDAAAGLADRSLHVLLQLSLDGDPRRGGADPADLMALAEQVALSAHLRLRGLMAVAPRGRPAAEAFARLKEHSERLVGEHPEAVVISAGMSADLEPAIACGATLVRVGTALLGPR